MRNSPLELAYVFGVAGAQSATHYYAPYRGHPSVPDIIRFNNDPYTLLENDVKGI
jgi:mannan endo-1,4-beta-mannosidase